MQITVAQDSLSTGLETTAMDGTVPALRVSWINWASGFRGSGLRVGDVVVAINGTPLVWPADADARQKMLPRLPGQYEEAEYWHETGASDGQQVTLRVRRRAVPGHGWTEIDIRGEVRSARTWTGDDGSRFLGPNGPGEMDSDGFDSPWSSWLEDTVREWREVLDAGWWIGPVITDPATEVHLQNKDRVAALKQKYSGPFASAAADDYDAVSRALEGRTYEVKPGDMDFRELGEKRVQQVAEAGRTARAAFLEKHAAEMTPAFPSIDPILGDRAKLAGKLTELPTITSREWIGQGPKTWFTFSDGNHYYFADGDAAPMVGALIAERRYEALVSPDVQANYAVIAKILPEPALVVVNEQACFGLKVEPVGVTIGDALFVEIGGEPEPKYAGEDALAAMHYPPPANDAAPEAVMATFFGALKASDLNLWRSLYADWTVFFTDNGLPVVNPGIAPSLESPWDQARREILDRVADVRVIWTDDLRAVVTGKEFDGAPRIDEVMVEVDHLRLRGGSFHSFAATGFTRFWTLQRMNGGPWRITSGEGI